MADDLDLLTLAEARAFLNIADIDTSENDELAAFITGLTPVVEAEVGPVVQREETAIVNTAGNCWMFAAPKWPVTSVVSGAYLDDETDVDVTKMIADKGMILTSDASPMPFRPWTMTYVAGIVDDTASVPQNIKSGAGEVLKLAWATQRGKEAPAFLISYRAAAWFNPSAFALGFA